MEYGRVKIKKKATIVIRTEAGRNIGLGHLSRTISLAIALKGCFDIIFIVNDEAKEYIEKNKFRAVVKNKFDQEDTVLIQKFKPEIIIVDSYKADSVYIERLRNIAKVVLFDDNAEHNPITSHVLINGNIHATDLNYDYKYEKTISLLGPKYLVMKPEYWDLEKESINDGEGILVTTGGADFHGLMIKFARHLKKLPIKKTLIIGPYYSKDEIEEIIEITDETFELINYPESLKEYIEKSKLVITAAGSTVYEVLTLNKPLIIYTVADNQKFIEHDLRKKGVYSLGDFKQINWNELSSIVEEVYYDNNYFCLFERFSNIFDGKGVFRIKNFLLEEVKSK